MLVVGALIFVVAFGTRFLYWQDSHAELLHKKPVYLGPATTFYYPQALAMLDSGGMLFPRQPVDGDDATLLAHPPGYSILILTLFKMFGEQGATPDLTQTVTALHVLQTLSDAVAAIVVFLIAAELFSASVAMIAAMLVSLSPHFAFYSLLLSPDSLVVLPILLTIYLVIRAIRQPRLVYVIGAGVLVGLSCWLRANALLLAPLVALAVALQVERGKRLRYALALIAATLITISPITIRNLVVFHHFIPLSVGAGVTLIEGLANVDEEGRFSLPHDDREVTESEAERFGRPDYGDDLFKPDGIQRDQARFRRGLEVVRAHPGWFLGVMLKRGLSMVRYNDFRRQGPEMLTTAPSLSGSPNFGHELEDTNGRAAVWTSSASELLAEGSLLSPQAGISLEGGALQISGDDAAYGGQFASALIPVRPNTDYVLRLALRPGQGSMDLKVGSTNPRVALTVIPVLASRKVKSNDTADTAGEPYNRDRLSIRLLEVPFASANNTEVRLVFYNGAAGGAVMKINRAEMFEVGPTPLQWTRPVRALIGPLQKNLFKTDRLRGLIMIGIILLALAWRWRALAVLLLVPAYYMGVQSALHTEYRYILAMHYFLFILAALSLYIAGRLMAHGGQQAFVILKNRAQHWRA